METPTPTRVLPLSQRVMSPVNASADERHPLWRGPSAGWPGQADLMSSVGPAPDVSATPGRVRTVAMAARGFGSSKGQRSDEASVVDVSGVWSASTLDGESSELDVARYECGCVQCSSARRGPSTSGRGGAAAGQAAAPSQRCIYGCSGVMVKERGRCAVRWHCLRCGATAVDRASTPPCTVDQVNSAFVNTCLPWVRVQRMSDSSGDVALFLGDVWWWTLPLSLATWIRGSVTDLLGIVSETVCAAAIWLWLERSSGACGEVQEHNGQRPWVWRWASDTGKGSPVTWEVVTSAGHRVAGAMASWTWTPDGCESTGEKQSPSAGTSDPEACELHGLSDDAFFNAVVYGAVPGLDRASGGDAVWAGKHRRVPEHESESELARVWTSRLWMWVTSPVRVAPSSGQCAASLTARLPWPAKSYVAPPLWDRTARTFEQESLIVAEDVLSPYIPLLSAPVKKGVTSLNASRWQRCLDGSAQQSAIATGLTWGFPVMVSPERSTAGAVIPQVPLAEPEHEAVSNFVKKSVSLGHMRDVSRVSQVPEQCGWVAPFVTVPKAGEPGQFRVCHNASAVPHQGAGAAGPAATSLASLNGDTDYSPLDPVSLLYLEWVVQRFRYLRAQYPDQEVYAWKMDAKHWFRQVPTRARDQHLLLQLWQGVLWAHLVLSFGLCAAVHICGLLSNGLADLAMALFLVVVRVFVDDLVCLEVGPRAAWSLQAVRLLGEFLGWLWNPGKTVGPCQVLPILGVQFDLKSGYATVLPERSRVVIDSCERLLQLASSDLPTTVGVLQELAGVCTFLSAVVPFGRLHTGPLYRLVGGSVGVYSASEPRMLDEEALRALQWWRRVLQSAAVPTQPLDWGVAPGRPLVPVYRVRVDAAGGIGLGALVDARGFWVLSDVWSEVEKRFSNNVLECTAATITVAACAPLFSGGVVLLETDNTCTLWCLRKGTARKPVLRWLTLLVGELQERFRFLLRVSHCSGARLVGADAASRQRRDLMHLLPRVRGKGWESLEIPPPARHLGPPGSGLLLKNASLARSSEQNLVFDTSRVRDQSNTQWAFSHIVIAAAHGSAVGVY